MDPIDASTTLLIFGALIIIKPESIKNIRQKQNLKNSNPFRILFTTCPDYISILSYQLDYEGILV